VRSVEESVLLTNISQTVVSSYSMGQAALPLRQKSRSGQPAGLSAI